MRRFILLSALALLPAFCNETFAQQDPVRTSPADVQALAERLENELFADCFFSMEARWEDGTPIASVNSAKKMCPASNMKLITSGAALLGLGEDYSWVTELSYSGKLSSDGILDGDIYIIGNGDPLLGANVKGGEAAPSLFAKWLALLRKSGIREIHGNIVGDGSWLEGMREEPGWEYEDLGTYYGTCLSGLNFYENRTDMAVVPGLEQGSALSFTPIYPETPWMRWDYQCSTGPKGTGDRLYLYTDAHCSHGVIRGTLALDRGRKVVMFRNNFPEYTLACEFRKYLQANGIVVSGSPMGIPFSPDVEGGSTRTLKRHDGELIPIGTTCSSPLQKVVEHTNKTSDNLCAELMYRTLGRKLMCVSDTDHAHQAVMSILKDRLGLDCRTSRFVMLDGSGLSGGNLLSAEFMCDFLLKMQGTSCKSIFQSSMLKYSDRVRFKTGSLHGCRTLCGYVLPSSPEGRTMVFSIMVNHSQKSIHSIDRQEKRIINALANL